MENKTYYTTEEAANIASYTIDYVGQLCRNKKIFCKRISGHWFVEKDDFAGYLASNGIHILKDAQEKTNEHITDEEVCMYDGVEYISSARSAEITGYTQDYVGQLARNGEITARKIGRRWFAGRESLLKHKRENELQEIRPATVGTFSSSPPSKNKDIHTETGHVLVPINTKSIKSDFIERRIPAKADVSFNVTYTPETDTTPLIPRMDPKITNAGIENNYNYLENKQETQPQQQIATSSNGYSSALQPLKQVRVSKRPLQSTSRNNSVHREISDNTHIAVADTVHKTSSTMIVKILLVVLSIVMFWSFWSIYYILSDGSLSKLQRAFKSDVFYTWVLDTSNNIGSLLPGSEYSYTAE